MSQLAKNVRGVKRAAGAADDSIASRIRAAVRGFGRPAGNVPPTSALLLDISSSMQTWLGANVRAIDKLRELADGFTDVRRFQFGSTCHEMAPDEPISEPIGSTAMHVAFCDVKRAGVKHVVLITDGEPDNEQYALRDAAGLRVDVFYVGPDPAPDFLKRLAGHTGGSYGKSSLDALRELGAAVRGLLPAGEGGVIQL